MLPMRYGLKQVAKVIMHQRMQQGREEVHVLIAATELTTAEWEDESEFRLNGHMYDVDGIEYHNGQKYYRCVADERETRIEHKADELIHSLSGRDRNQQKSGIARFLSDWLQGLYIHTSPQMPSVYMLSVFVGRFMTTGDEALEDPPLYRRIIPPEGRKA